MTEEINLDHKTFDLIGVLSGRDYPTLEVPVYFNESLGFEVFKLEQKRKEAILHSDEEAKELDEAYKALQEKSKSEEYVVLLKSIDESIRRDIHNEVSKEFPVKRDMLGREEVDPRWDAEYTKRMWAVYIQKVTDPTGAVSLVDEKVLEYLLAKAPRTAQDSINKGIAELQVGPSAGFEQLAQDANFLSDASPEG